MVVQKKQQTPAELFLDYAEKLLLAAENSERRNQKLEQQIEKNTESINAILLRLNSIELTNIFKKERDEAIEKVKEIGKEDVEKFKKTGMTIVEKFFLFLSFLISTGIAIWAILIKQ
jgi:seryl-tRNA synthetase